MTERDREIFYTNRNKIDYNQYLLDYVLGARRYCVREDPETLPYARKLLKRLYYLDILKNILLALFVLWMFSSYATMFLNRIEAPFSFSNYTMSYKSVP
jgi:fatty acyl-CoA reductase